MDTQALAQQVAELEERIDELQAEVLAQGTFMYLLLGALRRKGILSTSEIVQLYQDCVGVSGELYPGTQDRQRVTELLSDRLLKTVRFWNAQKQANEGDQPASILCDQQT